MFAPGDGSWLGQAPLHISNKLFTKTLAAVPPHIDLVGFEVLEAVIDLPLHQASEVDTFFFVDTSLLEAARFLPAMQNWRAKRGCSRPC